jgi:2,4-dichlorophenol 6-monooxygenase
MNTQFESYEEKDGYVLTTVLDLLTNKKYIIKAKYLYGADGANSRIAKQLGIFFLRFVANLELPFSGTPALSLAINVMVKVDLSAHVTQSETFTGSVNPMPPSGVGSSSCGWSDPGPNGL